LIKKLIKQGLRNKPINTVVRIPVKILLGRSSNVATKYFLSRIPVVGKFRMRLPDVKGLIIDTPRPDVDRISRSPGDYSGGDLRAMSLVLLGSFVDLQENLRISSI
jgi:hypothetical protein